jgi:uncharacterized membrane protein YfcA
LVLLWVAGYCHLASHPGALFLKNWIFIPVGFCGAVLGNISAVGGGIVFIPVTMFCFHLPPVTALKLALASQSFGMSSGAIGWLQKRVVPLKWLTLTIPALLLGSSISSLWIHPSALLVKLFFGPVSIVVGVITLMLSRAHGPAAGERDLPARAALPLFLISFLGGLLTGWVAIGEGELVAALLMLVYRLNISACIGLGVLLLAINSIYLALLHQFFLGGIPWDKACFTSLGCVFGARLAPYLSRYTRPLFLKSVFAVIAIGDGVLFIIQYVLRHHAD